MLKLRYFILLVLFVFLASPAHASSFSVDGGGCSGNDSIISLIKNMPGCVVNSFIGTFTSGFGYTIDQFLTSSFDLISAVPNLLWFCTPYNNVMAMIESLYTLAFMGLGLFYIFRSTDVEGRLAAKEWLKDIFMMILILSFSFQIFEILVSLNTYMTTTFLSFATKDVFNPVASFGSLVFAFIILLTAVVVLLLTFLTLLARYLLIPFLFILFPFSIFLYFIPFTKEWGAAFLRLIVSVVFMTTIDALLVMALSFLFSTPDPTLASGVIRAVAIILGFSLIGILNILLFISSFLSLINTAGGSIKYIVAGVIGKAVL
ncbi:Uncharacterised protein [uncultured archaeon]|nr:Uncharacterised protein [uncultured archaeon]